MSSISLPAALGLIAGAASAVWLAAGWRWLTRLLHILQGGGYYQRYFLRWLLQAGRRHQIIFTAALLLPLLTVGLQAAPWPAWLPLLGLVAWGLVGLLWLLRFRPPPAKHPLRWTPKALALATLVCLQVLLVEVALAVVGFQVGGVSGGAALAKAAQSDEAMVVRLWPGIGLSLGLGAGLALLPALLAVATLVVWPGQAIGAALLLRAARRKLRASNARVIGITGSYGKTSTKEFVSTLLAARYHVLKTPESYNTALGIARVLLRDLRPDHDYIVVELGTYGPGEIRRLCRLVRPRIGVLTAIGPQHLERFGSIERIAAAKYELIESLPADGVAVFNADDPRCRALAARTAGQVIRYSVQEPPGPDVHLAARRVEHGQRCASFTIQDDDGAAQPVTVALLGLTNVSNVLAAAAVARLCGLSLAEIASAARDIEPVPHRLQPIDGAGGVLVIDDAYNSNPVGAAAALDVLAAVPGRRKVLVTPGMVELGERHEVEHETLGRRAAAVCDTVVLVGPDRTAPILAGLRAAAFPAEHVIVVGSLAEATARLANLLGPGDVVLFENDLPDTYDEAP